MIKKILLPVFLLFPLITLAQQATSSPYSLFGIGDVRFRGTVENRLMGSISVFPDSTHINVQNPASYSSLKLATFSVGGAFNTTKINSFQGNDKAQRTTLDYMVIGMPVGKSGITLGLIPYSSVGYRVSNIDASGIKRRYEGTGGLNKVFLGYGYEINKNFSVGAGLNYNFGNIETNNSLFVPGIQLGTLETNTSDMSGFNINVGAMYRRKIKKYDFYGSLAYTPKSKMKINNLRSISTILYSEDYTPGVMDQLDTLSTKTNLKLPSALSIGAGFGVSKKWLIGTEVVFKQTGSFSNRFDDISQATFENGIQYSVGGYYIPDYNSFSSYFKRVTYRAGFRYEKTGLIVRNEKIKDYSFTGGFGFPLGGVFSNVNVGVEYGRRGTAKANLVEENYTNVLLSLSLNDKWFVKRKYD